MTNEEAIKYLQDYIDGDLRSSYTGGVVKPAIKIAIDALNLLPKAIEDLNGLIWYEGECEYCKFAEKINYCGASKWKCKLGDSLNCNPEWRGLKDDI